ncbi:DUF5082 domain-containing protein [Bacillaceae bacterium Marseille-Q3522]|nr:DUF5082 domain-containing protein [Bacillaceae bacterium Marseille-Q3522]
MDLAVLKEIERRAKREKYNMMLNILSGYRSNVKEAIEHIEEGERIFRRAHANYIDDWHGKAREAYEGITGELKQDVNRSYTIGDELEREIREEMRRLHRKIEDLS